MAGGTMPCSKRTTRHQIERPRLTRLQPIRRVIGQHVVRATCTSILCGVFANWWSWRQWARRTIARRQPTWVAVERSTLLMGTTTMCGRPFLDYWTRDFIAPGCYKLCDVTTPRAGTIRHSKILIQLISSRAPYSNFVNLVNLRTPCALASFCELRWRCKPECLPALQSS